MGNNDENRSQARMQQQVPVTIIIDSDLSSLIHDLILKTRNTPDIPNRWVHYISTQPSN